MRTANELLGIKRPEDLFPGNTDEAKRQYHALAHEWHPDKHPGNPLACDVFAHINRLYDDAILRLEKGTWEGEGVLELEDTSAKSVMRVQYYRKRPFELGQMYVANESVVYVIEHCFRDLYDNALQSIKGFQFANKKMEEECGRYLPKKGVAFTTPDKKRVLRIKKTPDLLSLRDVLNHLGGKLDPKHVAWVLSSLHNLACYLSYAGISHQDISPDTYFISPQYHSGSLLGGWWYSTSIGRNVSKLPTRTFEYLPWEVRSGKVASHLTDLELIRATGRELLGDITGSAIDAPDAMVEFLRAVSTESAVDTYAAWGDALTKSYGKRKFVELKLDAGAIYAKK